nr:hypothetical protein [Endozoicomonas sp.]
MEPESKTSEPSPTREERTTVQTTTVKGDGIHGDGCAGTPTLFEPPETPEINIQTLTSKFASLHCKFSEEVSKLNDKGLKKLKKLCQNSKQAEFDTLAKSYEASLNNKAAKITAELDKLIGEFKSWNDYDLHNTRIHNIKLAKEQKEWVSNTLKRSITTIYEIPEKYNCLMSGTEECGENPEVFESPDTPEVNIQILTSKFASLHCKFSEEVSKLNHNGFRKLENLCQKSKKAEFDDLANRYKASLNNKAAKITAELDKLIDEFKSWNDYDLHNTRIKNIKLAEEQKEKVLHSLDENKRAISDIPEKHSCLLNSEIIPTNAHEHTSSLTSKHPSTLVAMTPPGSLTTAGTTAGTPTTTAVNKTSPSHVTSTNAKLVHELKSELGALLGLSLTDLTDLSRLNYNQPLINTADSSKGLLSSSYEQYKNTLETAVNEKKQSLPNSKYMDSIDKLTSDSISTVSKAHHSASHEVDLQLHTGNLFDLFITTSSILKNIKGMNLSGRELLNELLDYETIEGISVFKKLIQSALDESRTKQGSTEIAEETAPPLLGGSDNNIGKTTFNKIQQDSLEIYNLAIKYRTALINSKRLPDSRRPPAIAEYLETQNERDSQNARETAAKIIRRLPDTMDNIVIEYSVVLGEEFGTCNSRLDDIFPQAQIRRQRNSDTEKTQGQDEHSGINLSNIELKDDSNVASRDPDISDNLSNKEKSLYHNMQYSIKTSFRYSNLYFRDFREKEEKLRDLLKDQSESGRPLKNSDVVVIQELLDRMKCYLRIVIQYYLASSNELDQLVTKRVGELEDDIKAAHNNPFLQSQIALKEKIIEDIRLRQKGIHNHWKLSKNRLSNQVNSRIEKTNSKISKLEDRYTLIMLRAVSGENDDTNITEPTTGEVIGQHNRQRRHGSQADQSAEPIPSGSSSMHRGILPGLRKITESVVLNSAAWLARSIVPSYFSKPSAPGCQTVNQPDQQVSALTERPEMLTFTAQTQYSGHCEEELPCEPVSLRITVTDEQGESRFSSAMNQSPLDQVDNGSNPMTQKLVHISQNAWLQESQSLQNGDIHDLRLPYARSEPFNAMAGRYANNHNGQLPPGFAKTEKGFNYTSPMDFTGTCDPQLKVCTVDSISRGYEDGADHIIRDAHQEARAQQSKERSNLYSGSLPVTAGLELANVVACLLTKRKIIPSRTADALHNASKPPGKADHNSPGKILTRDSFAIARGLHNEVSVFLARIKKTDPFVSQQWSTDDILSMSIITCAEHQPDKPGIALITGFVRAVLYSPELGIDHNLTDNVFTLDDQGGLSIYGNATDSSLAFQRKNDMEPASNNARAMLSCMLGVMARDNLKPGQVDNHKNVDNQKIVETALQLKVQQQQTVINTVAKYFNPSLNEPRQQRHTLEKQLAQLISNNHCGDNNGQPFDGSIASVELMGTVLRPDVDSNTVAGVKDLFFAHSPTDQQTCIEDLLKQPDIYTVGGSGQLEQKVRSDLSRQPSGGDSEERWQLFLYLLDTRIKVIDRINDSVTLMNVVHQRLGGSDEVLNESQQLARYMAEHLPQPITLYEQSIPEAERLLPVPF